MQYQTFISLLRGINVSGQKSIRMDDLKRLFEDLGCFDVQTYIQSGNVIFKAKEKECPLLAAALSEAIKGRFDFDVPVFVLDVNELSSIVEDNPFVGDPLKNPSFLHVTFLSSRVTEANTEQLAGMLSEGEDAALVGKVLYLYCPNGYGKTKLTNTFLERRLKVVATTRNWKTVNVLLDIASGKG